MGATAIVAATSQNARCYGAMADRLAHGSFPALRSDARNVAEVEDRESLSGLRSRTEIRVRLFETLICGVVITLGFGGSSITSGWFGVDAVVRRLGGHRAARFRFGSYR